MLWTGSLAAGLGAAWESSGHLGVGETLPSAQWNERLVTEAGRACVILRDSPGVGSPGCGCGCGGCPSRRTGDSLLCHRRFSGWTRAWWGLDFDGAGEPGRCPTALSPCSQAPQTVAHIHSQQTVGRASFTHKTSKAQPSRPPSSFTSTNGAPGAGHRGPCQCDREVLCGQWAWRSRGPEPCGSRANPQADQQEAQLEVAAV